MPSVVGAVDLVAYGTIPSAVAKRPHYFEAGQVLVRILLRQIPRLVLGNFLLGNLELGTVRTGHQFMAHTAHPTLCITFPLSHGHTRQRQDARDGDHRLY